MAGDQGPAAGQGGGWRVRHRRGRRPVVLTSTAVLGKISLPGQVRSVPRARAFVGRVLGPYHPCADVACLLVSELVTNAVQHSESRRAGGTVTVVVVDVASGIRVEVIDDGSAHSVPVVRDDALATDGRGLFLVQSLAGEWGYLRDAIGTTVWFRLSYLALTGPDGLDGGLCLLWDG